MLAAIKQIIDTTAAQYGVASWIAEDIAILESGGRPDAVGDHGTSFGLFQLHWGGQGTGYSAAQLKDPTLNAQIGISHMKDAYRQGVSKGLQGWNLLDYTATHSGHPGYGGVGHYPSYESTLFNVYKRQGGTDTAGVPTGGIIQTSAGGAVSAEKFATGSDVISVIDQSLKIRHFDVAHPLNSLMSEAGAISLRTVLVIIGIAILLVGLLAGLVSPFIK